MTDFVVLIAFEFPAEFENKISKKMFLTISCFKKGFATFYVKVYVLKYNEIEIKYRKKSS